MQGINDDNIGMSGTRLNAVAFQNSGKNDRDIIASNPENFGSDWDPQSKHCSITLGTQEIGRHSVNASTHRISAFR